jgi:flagellar basal body-associated protein FliL
MNIKNQKGAVLLILVIIIGVTSLVFFFAFTKSNLTTILDANRQLQATQGEQQLDSCIDEVLINFQFDPEFTTSTLNMDNYVCGLSLEQTVSSTIAIVSTTYDNIARGVRVILSTDPLVVESVENTLD